MAPWGPLLAHVQFRGTIRERSVEPYLRMLKALRSKRRIRGVLFDISSGGGADVPSDDLYRAVKRLDAVKPVIASIGSIGASGAYQAVLGSRRIYAYPDSIVGSIGVVFPHLATRGLLQKLGLSIELLHEGRHKDAYQGVRELTEEERTKLQAVVGDSYQSFVEVVARERKRSVDEIRNLATGEFWTAKRGLELGLIDVIGDREEALAELSRMTGVPARRTVRVSPPRPVLDRILSGGTGSVLDRIRESIYDGLEDLVIENSLGRRF
jgi:protease-4